MKSLNHSSITRTVHARSCNPAASHHAKHKAHKQGINRQLHNSCTIYCTNDTKQASNCTCNSDNSGPCMAPWCPCNHPHSDMNTRQNQRNSIPDPTGYDDQLHNVKRQPAIGSRLTNGQDQQNTAQDACLSAWSNLSCWLHGCNPVHPYD